MASAIFRLCIAAMALGVLIGCDQARQQEKVKALPRAKMLHVENWMHNINIGVHGYIEAFDDSLPIAAKQKTWFQDGQPNHSWLTAVLPFVEHKALFDQVKKDAAWDSASNTRIAEAEIRQYNLVSPKKTHTRFRHFAGAGTPLGDTETPRLRDIARADGISRTILFVFAAPEHAIHWMEPAGIPFDPDKPEEAIKVLGTIPSEGMPVAMCDGSLIRIYPNADPEEFAKMIRYNDGMPINMRKATGALKKLRKIED